MQHAVFDVDRYGLDRDIGQEIDVVPGIDEWILLGMECIAEFSEPGMPLILS